jgi:hypothetical protein
MEARPEYHRLTGHHAIPAEDDERDADIGGDLYKKEKKDIAQTMWDDTRRRDYQTLEITATATFEGDEI